MSNTWNTSNFNKSSFTCVGFSIIKRLKNCRYQKNVAFLQTSKIANSKKLNLMSSFSLITSPSYFCHIFYYGSFYFYFVIDGMLFIL